MPWGSVLSWLFPSVIVPKRESRMVDIEETYVTTEPCRARGWGE